MEREWADCTMKTAPPFEAEFKADLTLKMEIENGVCPLPGFIGNRWASVIEIGSFEVVSKTFF